MASGGRTDDEMRPGQTCLRTVVVVMVDSSYLRLDVRRFASLVVWMDDDLQGNTTTDSLTTEGATSEALSRDDELRFGVGVRRAIGSP